MFERHKYTTTKKSDKKKLPFTDSELSRKDDASQVTSLELNYFASVREPVDAVEDEEEERGDNQEEAVDMDVVVAAVILKHTISNRILPQSKTQIKNLFVNFHLLQVTNTNLIFSDPEAGQRRWPDPATAVYSSQDYLDVVQQLGKFEMASNLIILSCHITNITRILCEETRQLESAQ